MVKIKDWLYYNGFEVWWASVIVVTILLFWKAAYDAKTRHDGMEMVCWIVDNPHDVKTVFPIANGTIHFNERASTYSGRGLRYKMIDGEICAVRKPS